MAGTPPILNDRLYDIAEGEIPPGDVVSCGNRTELFRKQRRHAWQGLGDDVQYGVLGRVRACMRCGTGRFGGDD
jgi:hypothetical protein